MADQVGNVLRKDRCQAWFVLGRRTWIVIAAEEAGGIASMDQLSVADIDNVAPRAHLKMDASHQDRMERHLPARLDDYNV